MNADPVPAADAHAVLHPAFRWQVPARLDIAQASWRAPGILIGLTGLAQLDVNPAAWGTRPSPELLAAIDAIRRQHRDPAQ